MMREFLLIHFITTFILVVIVIIVKKSMVHALAAALITSIFPVGGILLVVILDLLPQKHLELSENRLAASYESIKRGKKSYSLTQIINYETETSVIPLEEALMFSEVAKRREAILNILKKDVDAYTSYIHLALKNEDSETSHYAASSILHSKRKLDLSMHEMSALYASNPNDSETALAYADLLDSYIKSVYLDKAEKKVYEQDCIAVLEKIVIKDLTSDQRYIMRLIQLFLGNHDLKRLTVYSNLFLETYRDTQEKYVQVLESFYVLKDKKQFDFVLKRLRESELTFSRETLSMVRFWMGVME